MTSPRFLLYFSDPYEVGNSRFAVADESSLAIIEPEQLESAGELITYDAPILVDELRRRKARPCKALIDASDAIRLCVGVSRADGGETKWGFWRRIRCFFSDERDWRLCRDIHEARAVSPNSDELLRLFGAFANAMISLWRSVHTNLTDLGELDRFYDVEVPAAQIFYRRQYSGIAIDTAVLKTLTDSAETDKYKNYQEVAKALDVSPTGLTYWNVGPHLAKTDVSELSPNATGYRLRDQMKIAAVNSNFAQCFTDYLDASRDLDILTRLADSGGRVFPTFSALGTITGRILVSDPYLQQLRRRYRSVISSDQGADLRYFDYSQFEPGVMASLSKDQALIALYNEGDVYTALSGALFGDAKHRQLCKRIFLGFSYGMSAKGIASLLGATDVGGASIEGNIENFFAKFATLNEYKKSLERRLKDAGKIGTQCGNYRLRNSSGELSAKERRWALSHVVQGSASLIFKEALIELAEEFGAEAMLLPMHDAILMQFQTEKMEASSQRVVAIMEECFTKRCPDISARVTVGMFSE